MDSVTHVEGALPVPISPYGRYGRITVQHVAEAAGVSKSTVSRAISGSGYVAPHVRARVLAAAERLGYVPDAAARKLKTGKGSTIGVIVSDLRNPFYAGIAYGAGLAARRAGHTMMLADDQSDLATELKIAKSLVSLAPSGVILAPLGDQVQSYLRRHDIPVVEIDRQFSADICDGVVVDNRNGARQLTEHLLAQGHGRICLIIDETNWTTGSERLAGYEDALRVAGDGGVAGDVLRSGWAVADAEKVAADALRSPRRPTAIFAANNVIAEGVWRAVAALGLRVPGDLSIVAFDDAPWMSLVNPGLTVAAQDPAALGAVAVERLLGRLKEPKALVRTVVLPVEIVLRGSSGSPSPRA